MAAVAGKTGRSLAREPRCRPIATAISLAGATVVVTRGEERNWIG